MITGYYCTNIFSEKAQELVVFYKDILEIPFIRTDVDDSNGVYLGFIKNAPTLCIWDCKAIHAQPTGYQSFVFQTENLDATMVCLKEKGVTLSDPIRYDQGTYEVRLKDPDKNEVVIVEFALSTN